MTSQEGEPSETMSTCDLTPGDNLDRPDKNSGVISMEGAVTTTSVGTGIIEVSLGKVGPEVLISRRLFPQTY